MRQLVKLADVIIGNEEDASDVFGIKSEGSAPVSGKLNTAGYREVAARLSAEFPKATRLRGASKLAMALPLKASSQIHFNLLSLPKVTDERLEQP